MKNLIILLIVVFSVSCTHLKTSERTVYIKSGTIKTIYNQTIKLDKSKVYFNPYIVEVDSIGYKYFFERKNIESMSIETVYIIN